MPNFIKTGGAVVNYLIAEEISDLLDPRKMAFSKD